MLQIDGETLVFTMVSSVVSDFIGLSTTVKDVTCRTPDLYLLLPKCVSLIEYEDGLYIKEGKRRKKFAMYDHTCSSLFYKVLCRFSFVIMCIPRKYGVSVHFQEMYRCNL